MMLETIWLRPVDVQVLPSGSITKPYSIDNPFIYWNLPPVSWWSLAGSFDPISTLSQPVDRWHHQRPQHQRTGHQHRTLLLRFRGFIRLARLTWPSLKVWWMTGRLLRCKWVYRNSTGLWSCGTKGSAAADLSLASWPKRWTCRHRPRRMPVLKIHTRKSLEKIYTKRERDREIDSKLNWYIWIYIYIVIKRRSGEDKEEQRIDPITSDSIFLLK